MKLSSASLYNMGPGEAFFIRSLLQKCSHQSTKKSDPGFAGLNFHSQRIRVIIWFCKMCIPSLVLLHCCRWTCMLTGLVYPNVVSPHFVPSLNWLLFRWGEGGDLWVAHFADSHTACGRTFRWDWGIGGITETQLKRQQQPRCLRAAKSSLLQQARPFSMNSQR